MERTKYDHTKLEGNDADLETSLKEYGLAWIETDTEYLFYYGIEYTEDCDFCKFDFSSFDKTTDLREEFAWVDFEGLESYIGMKFDDMTFTQKITDLLSYYSYENVFGSSYWAGLDYNEIVKD